MKQAVDRAAIAFSRLTRWEMAFWCVVVLLVWASRLWATPLFSAQVGTVALAIFCLRAFVGHGARIITPLGVFSLVTLMTAAFPAYAAWDDSRITPNALSSAVLLTLFFTVVSGLFSWSFGTFSSNRTVVPGAILFAVLGLAQFLLAYLVKGTGILPSIVVESLAIAGILVMAFGAWWHRSVWLLFLSLPLVLVFSAVYILQIHSGQGRLRIAALGLGLLVMFSIRVRGLWVKLLSILAGPVALMVFAKLRKAHQEQIHAGNSANRTGLESLTDPFVTFAKLIDLHDQSRFEFQGGRNLLTIFGDIAPSNWELPRAIGYELVKYWMPEKAKPGYEWFSVAANATGEWYWMWGVTGVILGSLAVGALLSALNWGLAEGVNKMAKKWLAVALFICSVTFAAGLSDLVWGGLHIYWARLIPRVLIELVTVCFVAVVMLLWAKISARDVAEDSGDSDTEGAESNAEPGDDSEEAVEAAESEIAETPQSNEVEPELPEAIPAPEPEPELAPEPEPEAAEAEPEPELEPQPVSAAATAVSGETRQTDVVKQSAANLDVARGLRVAAGAAAAVGALGAIGWLLTWRSDAGVQVRAEKWLREILDEQ